MRRIEYKAGQVISGLVFLEEVAPYRHPSRDTRKARFRCYCGNEFETTITCVRRGTTKSCGCYNRKCIIERATKHGLTKHPLHSIWVDMKKRCYNTNRRSYKNYGGRGIIVCDEWISDFKAFYNWATANGWQKGLHIDRIENDGDYEPSNCRCTTQAENNRNSRGTKLSWGIVREIRNAKLLLGRLVTNSEFATAYGVTVETISCVLNNKTWAEE